MLVVAVLANLVVQWAAFRDRLIRPDADRRALRRWVRLALVGPVIWAVALVVALTVSAAVALVLDVVALLLFLLDLPFGREREGSEPGRS
jgi:hypothetical protein